MGRWTMVKVFRNWLRFRGPTLLRHPPARASHWVEGSRAYRRCRDRRAGITPPGWSFGLFRDNRSEQDRNGCADSGQHRDVTVKAGGEDDRLSRNREHSCAARWRMRVSLAVAGPQL